VDETAPLHEWSWSYALSQPSEAFVYRAGRAREIPREGGVFTYEPLGVLAHGGWGSYFDPRRETEYRLTMEVLEPDAAASRYSVRLGARGGGWKS
jgi:hypothetical protein